MGLTFQETLAVIGTEVKRVGRKLCEVETEIDLHVCIPRHKMQMLRKTARIKEHLEQIQNAVNGAL